MENDDDDDDDGLKSTVSSIGESFSRCLIFGVFLEPNLLVCLKFVDV